MNKNFLDTLKDKSKDELILYLNENYGQTSVPSANKPTQPTKNEIIAHIRDIEKEYEESEVKEVVTNNNKKVNYRKILADMKKLRYEDGMKGLVRVRITRNALNQSLPDISNYMELISYGSVLDAKKAWVAFNVPWHLPIALVDKLDSILCSTFEQLPGEARPREVKNSRKVFNVERLPNLTKEQLKQKAERYKLAITR